MFDLSSSCWLFSLFRCCRRRRRRLELPVNNQQSGHKRIAGFVNPLEKKIRSMLSNSSAPVSPPGTDRSIPFLILFHGNAG
jgi:hypothetical protein